jgi:hypothetical protein
MKDFLTQVRKNRNVQLLVISAILLNLFSLYAHFNWNFLGNTGGANAATLSWFLSIISFGVAIYILPAKLLKENDKVENFTKQEIIIFVGILLFAFALRLYKLTHQGIYLDEWYWITNAKDILAGIIQTPFGFIGDQPSNMPAYVVAGFYVLTGDVYHAVRLPGLLYSLGTIFFVTLFLKNAYNKKVAIFSALILATSIWDIHMSQLGWNNVNLNPFLISGTLYFLYKTLKIFSLRDAFFCGVFLGISINLLYIAALSTIVVAVIFVTRFISLHQKKLLLAPFIILCFTTFIVTSPTIAKIVRYPDLSIRRHQEFLRQNEDFSKQKNGLLYYADQARLAVFDLGYDPQKYKIVLLWGITIEPSVLLLVLIGALYVLRNIKYFPNQILILDYIVMLIPVVVMYRFTSIWREYGFVPVLYIAASLGMYFIYNALSKNARLIKIYKSKTPIVVAAFITFAYLIQWSFYFNNYFNDSLKKDPVMYETVCKYTTSFIENNISAETLLFLPNELCSQLITVVLDGKYQYRTYNNALDLQSYLNSSTDDAVIIFTRTNINRQTDHANIDMVLGSTHKGNYINGADGALGAIVYTR